MKSIFYLILLSSAVLVTRAQPNYGPNRIFYQSEIAAGNFTNSQYNKKFHRDANGDGIADMILMTGTSISVCIASSAGDFTSTSVPVGSYAMGNFGSSTSADFNGDGKPDFAWYNSPNNDIIVSYWSSNSSGLPVYTAPARLNITGINSSMGVYGLNAADLDGDGDVDMLAFGPNGIQKPHMMINNGNGTFTRYDLHGTAAYQSYSQVTDINNDGKLDVVAGEGGGIVVYLNNGNSGSPLIPSFTKYTLVNSTLADGFDSNNGYFDIIDLNNDGKKDLVLNYQKYISNAWVAKARIFINTTTSAPSYNFTYAEVVNRSGSPYEVLGFAAKYEDADANGTLDIIGTRGGSGAVPYHKLSVARVFIDGSNNVTLQESTLIDYGPYTSSATSGLFLAADDFDGDSQRDYMVAYSSGRSLLSYRSKFPSYSQTNTAALTLSNKLFIGGSNTDNATLTLSLANGSGTFNVSGSSGGTVSGNGSGAVTVSGTVLQINNSLSAITYTPSTYGLHTLAMSVTNSSSQTYTGSIGLTCARTPYYPKVAGASSLNVLSSWSSSSDGSGASPADFNADKEFVLSNTSGTTSFATSANWVVGGKITIPTGTSLNTGGYAFSATGDVTSSGSVTSTGTTTLTGATAQLLAGANNFTNLVISNSAGVTLSGPSSITSSLVLTTGVLTTGSNTLTLQGTLSRTSGSIAAATGTVRFNGQAAQTVPDQAFTGTIGTLVVDNPAGVTMGGSVMTGTLVLTNGLLTLGSADLMAATVSGGTASSYVKTTGTGKLRINAANGASISFPVGNSAYNPVSITNNTGIADEFAVLVLDEVYVNGTGGTAVNTARIKRTWDISKLTANGGSGISMTFNWNNNETVNLTTPSLFHYESGSWVKKTGTTSATATSLTFSGYTGTFSPFAVGETNLVLPVNRTSFAATLQQAAVHLTWQTASEQNARDFGVEHSRDGANWSLLGRLPAAGNSTAVRSYGYNHTNPPSGLNYYRLVQADKDGKVNYSDVITLYIASGGRSLSLYPNPVRNGRLTVVLEQADLVQVFSNNGTLVLEKQMAPGIQPLDLQRLPRGLYMIKTQHAQQQIVIE